MFESITISFEGDDNMSVNIMRILSLYLASLRYSFYAVLLRFNNDQLVFK